jgi:hypothetical protein
MMKPEAKGQPGWGSSPSQRVASHLEGSTEPFHLGLNSLWF